VRDLTGCIKNSNGMVRPSSFGPLTSATPSVAALSHPGERGEMQRTSRLSVAHRRRLVLAFHFVTCSPSTRDENGSHSCAVLEATDRAASRLPPSPCVRLFIPPPPA
jgi:hypothetical protein